MRSWALLITGLLTWAIAAGQASSPAHAFDVMVRCDDAGMSHAVNAGFERLAMSGLPFSASVMVPCAWFPEAVEVLDRHPHVSVGIHLTLNSEWKGMRWRPVAGARSVPSLVDSLGFFFPSRALLMAHAPRLDEVEKELRAQIQTAIEAGLRPAYVDYHMGAAVGTPELRAIVEKLAAEFKLGVSRYFGEQDVDGLYRAMPGVKVDTLVAMLGRLKPGVRNLIVCHIADPSAEMDALTDLNASGLPEMGRHRAGELTALLSPRFREAAQVRGVRFLTYRDIIAADGLAAMQRPAP
ncbi:MAG: ChbG/HpnK family deacetylase [Bacteroidetes bacterium]|jgi:hypothetical protein|nr:ChbG/HpnK family deacetylase [Bacteroidota bacterium]